MGLLIYAALTVGLVLLSLRSRTGFFPFLLQFLPFFFLFGFFWATRDQFQIVQIHKNGYQFQKVNADYREPSRSITIGGDSSKDDVYIQGIPAQAVRLTPSLVDSKIQAAILADGILLLRNGEPLNVVPLEDDHRIAKGGSAVLTYNSLGSFRRQFEANGKSWSWPRKQQEKARVREPISSRSLTSQAFFLSDIAKELGVEWRGKTAVTLQNFHFTLSRRPFQMNRVLLITSGAAITVNEVRPPARFEIQSGDRISVLSIEALEKAARLRPRGSYILKNAETLNVYYPDPRTLGVKEELLRHGSSINKPLLITTGNLPYSIFPTARYEKESSRFANIFAFVQSAKPSQQKRFPQRIKDGLMAILSMEPKIFEVVTDEGTFRPASGEQIAIGRQDKILLTIEQVRYPWNVLYIAFMLLLLKMVFQAPFFLPDSAPSRTGVPAAQLILISADFFLVTRLLFAFRATSLYPYSTEAVPLALYTILLFPYLLFAIWMLQLKNWSRQSALNFILYSLAVILIAGFFFPQRLWFTAIAVFLLAGIAFLRFGPDRFRRPVFSIRTQWNGSNGTDRFLLGFFAAAFLLHLFEVGEALHIAGIRVPLTLLYHPVFVVFTASYLYQLWRQRNREVSNDARVPLRTAMKLAGAFAGFLLLSFLMKDIGFFLVYCLPVVFVAAAIGLAYFREYEFRWKSVGLLLVAPAGILLLLFSIYSTIGRILPGSYLENRYVQRAMLALNPSALQETGLVSAEKLLGHQRLFLAYAHSGWTGGGYMNRSIHPALGSTALNDNVPAAFLLNDFGVAGLVGALLVMFCWLLLWYRAVAGHSRGGIPLFISLAAVLTLVYANFYMILANCGVFLFTGKNVFLWGLNSLSDVLHSTLVFALILLPFAREQESVDSSIAITQPIRIAEVPFHA